MGDLGATIEMPPKKRASKMGRPKAPEPVYSLAAIKGTRAFEAWLDKLVEHSRFGTRTLLIKNALKEFAENHDFEEPSPKR